MAKIKDLKPDDLLILYYDEYTKLCTVAEVRRGLADLELWTAYRAERHSLHFDGHDLCNMIDDVVYLSEAEAELSEDIAEDLILSGEWDRILRALNDAAARKGYYAPGEEVDLRDGAV